MNAHKTVMIWEYLAFNQRTYSKLQDQRLSLLLLQKLCILFNKADQKPEIFHVCILCWLLQLILLHSALI